MVAICWGEAPTLGRSTRGECGPVDRVVTEKASHKSCFKVERLVSNGSPTVDSVAPRLGMPIFRLGRVGSMIGCSTAFLNPDELLFLFLTSDYTPRIYLLALLCTTIIIPCYSPEARLKVLSRARSVPDLLVSLATSLES